MQKKAHKLMQITHDLQIGGLQRVVVNICKKINREIFDISILCLNEKGEFAAEIEKMGIEVILLPQLKKGTDYFAFFKIAKILKEKNIEIIHTHNTQPFLDGTIAGLLSGVKTVIHTDHARKYPDKRRYMFAEWLMSHFTYKVVGVSDNTSRDLMKWVKISKSKITTIPNGIDGSVYHTKVDKTAKKQELDINSNGPIIGLGVRLEVQKGLIYLINAMPEIIKEFPDITLVIAGEGNHKEELINKTKSLGITDNVRFVGSRLDMSEIIQLFDIYVLPSLWEGLPMVLLEAMAAGCPIISTDVGGVATAITHGENGSLIKPKDSASISREVVRLLKKTDLMEKYRRNGIEKYNNEYSADIMTKRYQRLYLRDA